MLNMDPSFDHHWEAYDFRPPAVGVLCNRTARLFGLRQALGEPNNLAPTQPDKLRETLAMLEARRKDVLARMTAPH